MSDKSSSELHPQAVTKLAGFTFGCNGLQVALPDFYPPEARERPALRDQLLMFRTIRRYRAVSRTGAIDESPGRSLIAGQSPERIGIAAVEAALEIALDYNEQGLWIFSELRTVWSDHGRIDWVATARREQPAFCGDGPVYTGRLRRTLRTRDAHPLTLLHANIVLDLMNHTVQVGLDPPPVPAAPLNRTQAKRLLVQSRASLFRDRDIRLLSLIQAYLAGRSLLVHEGGHITWQMTDDFHCIWERICIDVFGLTRPPLPCSEYRDVLGRPIGRENADLKLDGTANTSDGMLIMDAKCYSGAGLPEAYELVKQRAYAHYLSSHWQPKGHSPDRIFNVFALPRIKKSSGTAFSHGEPCFEIVGANHVKGGGIGRSMGGPIWVVEVDYRRVARAFATGARLNLSELVAELARRSGVVPIPYR